MKVKLAPGAFDDIPEDEQEELFKEIELMAQDDAFFENSEPVDLDKLKEEDPELYELLTNRIEVPLQ